MATPNMGMTAPTVGASTGTWGTTVNSDLDLIDAHDHSSGKGPRITPSGLNIDAALTFAGNPATNLSATRYAAQAASPGARSVYFKGDDLYIADGNNVEIRATAGGQLNMSLVGGIVGDYAAAGAALYYDDTAQAYRFLEAAPGANSWSYAKVGGLDLYQHASGIATFVRLKSPAALAASYDLTFPGALPGAGTVKLVQVNENGTLTFAGSRINETFTVPACAFQIVAVASAIALGTIPEYDGIQWLFSSDASGVVDAPLRLPVGATIKSITWHFNKASQAAALTMSLRKSTGGAASTAIDTESNGGNGAAYTTATRSPNYVVEAGYQVFLRAQAGHASHQFGYAVVTCDWPT